MVRSEAQGCLGEDWVISVTIVVREHVRTEGLVKVRYQTRVSERVVDSREPGRRDGRCALFVPTSLDEKLDQGVIWELGLVVN